MTISSDDTDVQLMLTASTGDNSAFETLVKRHQRPLLNFFWRMGVSNVAEDLVQQTFIRLYRYRKRYRARAKFTTFLYLLARQVWIDEIRRCERQRKLQAEVLEESEIATGGAIPMVASDGLSDEMQYALQTLSPAMRAVVVLGVLQGLEYAEIARILKIPLGTVKSRMFNALRLLRQTLSAGNNDERE